MPDILSESAQITVTRHGYPVATIISNTAYEQMHTQIKRLEDELASLQETIEILQDKELMEEIRQSMMAIQEGKVYTLEEARQMLDLA